MLHTVKENLNLWEKFLKLHVVFLTYISEGYFLIWIHSTYKLFVTEGSMIDLNFNKWIVS